MPLEYEGYVARITCQGEEYTAYRLLSRCYDNFQDNEFGYAVMSEVGQVCFLSLNRKARRGLSP